MYKIEKIAPDHMYDCIMRDSFEGQTSFMLTGDNDYSSLEWNMDDMNHIVRFYSQAAYALQDVIDKESYVYKTATEVIEDYFPSKFFHGGRRYSTKTIHAVKEALLQMDTSRYYSGEVYLDILRAITGVNWDTVQICGAVQCEWMTVIYDADVWDYRQLKEYLEPEVFNMGTEVCVYESSPIDASMEEQFDYFFLPWCYSDDEIAEKCAEYLECELSDVHIV